MSTPFMFDVFIYYLLLKLLCCRPQRHHGKPPCAQGGLCDSWDIRCKIVLPTWNVWQRSSRILSHCKQAWLYRNASDFEPCLTTWNHGVLTHVDTFLLVSVQVRKGLNEGPIYWMSVWLQLTFTRCTGLWMPWSMVDVICMIQHDPTLLKGTGWLMRTRAMRMWLQRMSSAVGRSNSTRAACGSFLALCGGLLGDKTSTCINMQRSINRSNNSPVDSPSQLFCWFCWQRLIEIGC